MNTFDTDPCPRCSGTGYHGPRTVEGGRCFDCNGKGRVLSDRGLRQRATFRAAFTIKTRDVETGMVLTGNGFKRLTVAEIEDGGTIIVNGSEKRMVTFRNTRGMAMTVGTDSEVQRLPTTEERDKMMKKIEEME